MRSIALAVVAHTRMRRSAVPAGRRQEPQGALESKASESRTAPLLAKLSHANVWSVQRTQFRLKKIEGLDDLKNTPFMVKLILNILPVLIDMASSPSVVKQVLFF